MRGTIHAAHPENQIMTDHIKEVRGLSVGQVFHVEHLDSCGFPRWIVPRGTLDREHRERELFHVEQLTPKHPILPRSGRNDGFSPLIMYDGQTVE